jgi:glucosylglycerate synthase
MSRMRVAVGIPSYREADTIADVVRLVDEGLAALPAPCEAVIVNVDGESDDGTVARFLSVPTRSRKVSIVAAGPPAGKGRNIRELFAYAVDHAIDAIAMIDADIRTATPSWAPALLEPVMSGRAHYVVPDYLRSRFRGTGTNHFAYPILYGWLGADMRQPIGGDFGLSRSFAEHLLSALWPDAAHGYGIDLFMSGHAVTAGVPGPSRRSGRRSIASVGPASRVWRRKSWRRGSTLKCCLSGIHPSWVVRP